MGRANIINLSTSFKRVMAGFRREMTLGNLSFRLMVSIFLSFFIRGGGSFLLPLKVLFGHGAKTHSGHDRYDNRLIMSTRRILYCWPFARNRLELRKNALRWAHKHEDGDRPKRERKKRMTGYFYAVKSYVFLFLTNRIM